MIICVDFDGTIVTHEFPNIGRPVDYALETLTVMQNLGFKIILWTMRSGESLEAAVAYLEENGIKLFGVNSNPDQSSWTNSPKAYAEMYIDDAAFGCPLIFDATVCRRPFVDWKEVRKQLKL